MPNITVQELLDRAAAAADMQGNFVTQQQGLYWATRENQKLAVKVAQLGYVLNESYVDITIDGSAEYAVPEMMAVIGVYEITSTNLLRRVRTVSPFEGHRQVANQVTGPARQYHVHRDSTLGSTNVLFSFFPNPTSGTYRVYLVPHPPKFTAVTDSVDYPMGWEERIVLGIARRMLGKEESDDSSINEQIREEDSDIEAAVWGRLLGEAPVIRNVDGTERGWMSPFPCPWPPASEWHFI